MSKKVRSMRGEVVDFDLYDIKNQMSKSPQTADVKKREKFIDKKRRRVIKKTIDAVLNKTAQQILSPAPDINVSAPKVEVKEKETTKPQTVVSPTPQAQIIKK